jgi:hypothetical protein
MYSAKTRSETADIFGYSGLGIRIQAVKKDPQTIEKAKLFHVLKCCVCVLVGGLLLLYVA